MLRLPLAPDLLGVRGEERERPRLVLAVLGEVQVHAADDAPHRIARAQPVLDGAVPPDLDAYVRLVREVAADAGEVLVHCDSGRGRAPMLAAALLVARGIAPDRDTAVAVVRAARPVASPTRNELEFLAAVCAALACPRATVERVAASAAPV